MEVRADIDGAAVADFEAWYFSVLEGIEQREVPDMAVRVVKVLMEISYRVGRIEARVESLGDLAAASYVMAGNLSRVLNGMERAGLIRHREELVRRDAGRPVVWHYYEVLPAWQGWRYSLQWIDAEVRRAQSALGRLKEVARLEPGQMELVERQTPVEGEFSRAMCAPATVAGEMEKEVVPGTSDRVVRGTSGEVVPGTSDPPGNQLQREPGDSYPVRVTAPPLTPLTPKGVKGVVQLKGITTPLPPSSPYHGTGSENGEARSLKGVEGAAVAGQEEDDLADPQVVARLAAASMRAARPNGASQDPDHALLLERMWMVIPDQRSTRFAGGWVNRCKAVPRAMRMAVDKFLETRPKVRETNWQWLRGEYIAAARQMGQGDKLSEEDRGRRGWWTRIAEKARSVLFAL